MKIKSIFTILCSVLLVFASISCKTVSKLEVTMPEATLDLGNLNREQFVIMGKISGEAEIAASSSSIEKENRAIAEGVPKYNTEIYVGDSFKYGYIGNKVNTNMTAEEKAVANATYKMIELARYNDADAILYVNTTTEITDGKIIAKVSGWAIKIKADEGYEILSIPESEDEAESAKETPAPTEADNNVESTTAENETIAAGDIETVTVEEDSAAVVVTGTTGTTAE